MAVPGGAAPQTTATKEDTNYWVSPGGPNRAPKVFATGPDGENVEIGEVSVKGFADLLNSVSKRNEFDGSWDRVPESVAMSLTKGELGLKDYVVKMYDTGKAGVAEGMMGWQALSGKDTYDNVLPRADLELLKMQTSEYPAAAWDAGVLNGMGESAKWALGVTAKALPSMVGGLAAGAEAAPLAAAGMAGVAATMGPAGVAAIASPAGFATLLSGTAVYGMLDFTTKVTAGSIALDLKRQGVDEKLIGRIAPVAGLGAGLLEVGQFKFLTAPLKRVFLSKVMGNAAVKGVMTKWVSNYLKETGAEAGIEGAQQIVEEYSKNLALMLDGKEDKVKSHSDIAKASVQAAVEAFVAFGFMKAPGAVMEAVAGKEGKAAPKKEGAPTPAPKAVEAAAPVIEQEILAEVPAGVSDTLNVLNQELNPAAPDADIAYREMGRELAGRGEEVDAALSVKEEALRAEQSDILLSTEEELTPQQQERVAAIQNELTLLGEMRTGMAEGPVAPETAPPPAGTTPAPAKPVSGVQQRVKEAVAKAREKKLTTELQSTLDMVKEMERSRDRLEKAEKSTRFIDQKIKELMGRVYEIEDQRVAIAEGAEVKPGEALEMKPATLASIAKAAFTQGRKEVVQRRAGLINEIAAQHGLSDRDVRLLTKTRNLGTMSDLDFKKYLDKLREDAAKLAERKQAYIELQATKEAKGFKREDNIRRLYGLPPVSKMTADQMRMYAEILEGFETGDEFWTPKRMEALKNTRWKGARTIREVIEAAAKELGVTPEVLKEVKVSEFDRFRYDTLLARQNPLYEFMVDEVKQAELKNAATYYEVRQKLFDLAEAAEKSRERSLTEKLVPQQEAVMKFIEAEKVEDRAAIAATMTKEELALAEYIQKVYADAYQYLLVGKDLSSSRFADGRYIFHAKRDIGEVLLGVKDVGIKETVKELFERWKLDETRFEVADERTGRVLGLRKFFRQTLFRTGELTPTKNVVRATDVYLRQFFRKKSLDEAVPSVETLVMALSSVDRTDTGKRQAAALQTFVKEYLNAKKGQAAVTGIVQGGKLDAAIRFTTNLVSLQMLALNIPLQIASVVGETVAKIPALGARNLVKAQYRKTTKQGKAILNKYKFFTGEGVFEEVFRPGQTLEERFGLLVYGLFKWSRMNTMQDLLLGNMTEAEFNAGEISNARLAEIKRLSGRWLDVGNMKSVIGTTSSGAAMNQFKSWAVPIMASTADIAIDLAKTLKTQKNQLSKMQIQEIYRLAEIAAVVAAVTALAGEGDKDDDSFIGRAKFYALRELMTLTQALSLPRALATPAAFAWVQRLANNLTLLVTLEKNRKGEPRGWSGLKRQMTPALVRQMVGDGKKKDWRKGSY